MFYVMPDNNAEANGTKKYRSPKLFPSNHKKINEYLDYGSAVFI